MRNLCWKLNFRANFGVLSLGFDVKALIPQGLTWRPNYFGLLNNLMTLIICESLREIGEMTCVTSAWSSRGQTLKNSDFLRMSRIGRHSRKIDFSYISLKHTFGWTYSRENSLKFQRFILRPKFKKVRNLHLMVFSGLKLSVRDLKNVWCLSSLISALVPEIFKFEKWVTYANEMTDDVIHST